MKYPLGIQTFSKIREDDYVYVDKTALIHELITSGTAYFFSRPRRFGKSLLISTLESVFRGEKALFDGLAIGGSGYEFVEYPVVLFEFTRVLAEQAADVKRYIINTTNNIAEEYSVELTLDSFEERLGELFEKLYKKTGKPVAFLVDEYDKPILDNLFDEQLTEIRSVLAGFYATVKQSDKFLKFVFITGVSKFAKLSVFSGMNSLTDISMEREYSALCGLTQQELEDNFAQPIDDLAKVELLEREALLAKIKHWYNGYQFHHQSASVYNPYSLLSLWRKQEFKNYWFSTATPTFLLDLLQRREYDLKGLTDSPVGERAFDACEPESMGVQSVFLQTGYLTIKSYEDELYTLDFPNNEVRKSFYNSVVDRYSMIDAGLEQSYVVMLIKHLKAQQLDEFFRTLSVFFANIPNNITIAKEKYYQSLCFAVFKLIGLNANAEVNTNIGRLDCVIEMRDVIYIIEFKLDGTKEQALQQIIDNKYAQAYQLSDKNIILVGAEFDQQGRNIAGFVSRDFVI